jgi:uncharacterized protein (TIGR02453 family)
MPVKKPAPAPAKFEGFDKNAMGFWHELTSEMNKEWFDANKARYESEWVKPMQALLDDVAARLAVAYKPVKLGAPKVMRIYRDVRFSKDKTPYKTHIGAAISVAGKSLADGGHTALYIHVGLDEEFVGVGCYMFDAPKLAKWRKAVGGKKGEELAKLVAKLRKAGYEIGGHDDYKKVPKGFDEDHPRAEFLKMKGLTGSFPAIPKGLLLKPGLSDFLVTHGKAMAPMVKWLQTNV